MEDIIADGRIMLRLIFRMWDVGHWPDRSGSVYGQLAGTCISTDEHSGSIKSRKILDQL